MSTFNTKHNRAVWFDIPVSNLDRAIRFYAAVLGIQVSRDKFGEVEFGVLEHSDGNAGCLVIRENEVTSNAGILLYLNVNGRIQDAVAKVSQLAGRIVEPIHSIGPHGLRAIVLDSEGNRIALHSETGA